jgi:cytochrome P450
LFLFIILGLIQFIWVLDGGSADTTAGTIAGFLLHMVLHPDIQKKAQAEIDRVVGSERLPTFAE